MPIPACGGVLHDHDLGHVPELREVLPDTLWCGLPGQPAHEHLAGIVGDFLAEHPEVQGRQGGEEAALLEHGGRHLGGRGRGVGQAEAVHPK